MHLYNMDAFGKSLKQLREVIGLTQADVYESTGISEDTLRRIENGHTIPKLETLFYLSLMYKTNLLPLLNSFAIFNAYTECSYMNTINRMIIKNEYNEIEIILAEIEKNFSHLSSQFIDPLLVSRLTLLKNFIEIIHAYKQTDPQKLDIADMKSRILSHLIACDNSFHYPLENDSNLNPIELRLLLVFSEILRIESREDQALSLLEKLKNITQKKLCYDPIFKELDLKISFNIAYCYHKLDQHDLVIENCDQSLNQCIQSNLLHLMHLFLFRKAIALHYLNRIKDSKITFNECLTLLKLTQQTDLLASYQHIYYDLPKVQ